jgi:hypothetical protein
VSAGYIELWVMPRDSKKRITQTAPTRGHAYTVAGDFVVTPVAKHFAIGRVTADGHTQSYIETKSARLAALKRACELAGKGHRVFLARAERHGSTMIDCTELAQQSLDRW